MKKTTTILAALGLAASGSAAFAAAHAMDPAAVTCAEYIAMDDEGKMGLAEAVKTALESPADADALMIEIDAACSESGAEDLAVLTAATAG
ncbi:HdeA/HdeB family protein [Roseivivax lentus]|uniref:HdeA/HdeB family protein n=1 Tax=Roseivivax lentus TaxID=633194 RepID=A0A1N7MGA3_9RHOB|nr:hypothetical protein [Roseivivax lentus]SIS85041.1 HdeA/HdeB family protein [Roseivivax lentus]